MILNFDEAFKILEIEPTNDKKKIKIAYFKMLKKYHPEEFPEMFMKINEAYRVALEFEKFDFNLIYSIYFIYCYYTLYSKDCDLNNVCFFCIFFFFFA